MQIHPIGQVPAAIRDYFQPLHFQAIDKLQLIMQKASPIFLVVSEYATLLPAQIFIQSGLLRFEKETKHSFT
jgi:hypothetical protein